MKKWIRENIRELAVYHAPEHRRHQTNLDLNESPDFLNDQILAELRDFDSFVVSTYPEYGELTSEVAAYAGRSPAEVLVTSGSDQGIQLWLQLLFSENDEVVAPVPTFFVYLAILKIIGAKVIPIKYGAEAGHFVFPYQATLEALNSRIKGLLLCQPNNPLGGACSTVEMIGLLERARSLEIPVIVDEAYFEFSGLTVVNLLDQFPNLIILRTFSKAFGLSGVRLGYALAAPDLINEVVKLRLPWAVNHFAVHAGKVVLKHQAYFREQVQQSLKTKAVLAKKLRALGYQVYETKTNFLLLKSSKLAELLTKLTSEKVLVNNISHYPYAQGLLEDTIRLSTPRAGEVDRLTALLDVD